MGSGASVKKTNTKRRVRFVDEMEEYDGYWNYGEKHFSDGDSLDSYNAQLDRQDSRESTNLSLGQRIQIRAQHPDSPRLYGLIRTDSEGRRVGLEFVNRDVYDAWQRKQLKLATQKKSSPRSYYSELFRRPRPTPSTADDRETRAMKRLVPRPVMSRDLWGEDAGSVQEEDDKSDSTLNNSVSLHLSWSPRSSKAASPSSQGRALGDDPECIPYHVMASTRHRSNQDERINKGLPGKVELTSVKRAIETKKRKLFNNGNRFEKNAGKPQNGRGVVRGSLRDKRFNFKTVSQKSAALNAEETSTQPEVCNSCFLTQAVISDPASKEGGSRDSEQVAASDKSEDIKDRMENHSSQSQAHNLVDPEPGLSSVTEDPYLDKSWIGRDHFGKEICSSHDKSADSTTDQMNHSGNSEDHLKSDNSNLRQLGQTGQMRSYGENPSRDKVEELPAAESCKREMTESIQSQNASDTSNTPQTTGREDTGMRSISRDHEKSQISENQSKDENADREMATDAQKDDSSSVKYLDPEVQSVNITSNPPAPSRDNQDNDSDKSSQPDERGTGSDLQDSSATHGTALADEHQTAREPSVTKQSTPLCDLTQEVSRPECDNKNGTRDAAETCTKPATRDKGSLTAGRQNEPIKTAVVHHRLDNGLTPVERSTSAKHLDRHDTGISRIRRSPIKHQAKSTRVVGGDRSAKPRTTKTNKKHQQIFVQEVTSPVTHGKRFQRHLGRREYT